MTRNVRKVSQNTLLYTFCFSHFASLSCEFGVYEKCVVVKSAIQFSYFAGILRMFLRNTPRNAKHSLYTFRISGEFRVLLMPQKNKPRNPLSFYVNASHGAKCEKQKKGRKVQKKWGEIARCTLFVFRSLCPFSYVLR